MIRGRVLAGLEEDDIGKEKKGWRETERYDRRK